MLLVSRFLALMVSCSALLGCGVIPLPRSPVSVFPLSPESVSWPTALATPGSVQSELRAQRLYNLRTRLHPVARALVYAHDAETQWARDSALMLRPETCAGALQVASVSQLDCSLLALGDGRAALLVLSAQQECRAETCVEHSWVFLSGHAAPLPMPINMSVSVRARMWRSCGAYCMRSSLTAGRTRRISVSSASTTCARRLSHGRRRKSSA